MVSPNISPIVNALNHRCGLKVISGLHNVDPVSVSQVVQAAQAGGATWVDIAADASLIALVKGLVDLPICVSAVIPEALAMAVQAGADCVEIGNYDSFYASGRQFSAAEVIALTQQTRRLLPHTLLSVTVPHTLPLDQQVILAEALVEQGADIIQTEGGTSSAPHHSGSLGLIEKAAPTLAATYEISRAVAVPVMAASGLSPVTVGMAMAAGASAVGVGSAIHRLGDTVAMVAQVRSLVAALVADPKLAVR